MDADQVLWVATLYAKDGQCTKWKRHPSPPMPLSDAMLWVIETLRSDSSFQFLELVVCRGSTRQTS